MIRNTIPTLYALHPDLRVQIFNEYGETIETHACSDAVDAAKTMLRRALPDDLSTLWSDTEAAAFADQLVAEHATDLPWIFRRNDVLTWVVRRLYKKGQPNG